MPPISRLTDMTTTGHLCTPEITLGLTTNINVFVTGMPACRIGDKTTPHTIEVSLNPLVCGPHVGTIHSGIVKVCVFGGVPVSTIGSQCDIAGLHQTGAPTVIAGGTAGDGAQAPADGSRNSLGQQTGGGAAQGWAPRS
jgi:uncharacterized Zn-binding protein involved in type VI secretion